ncbi:MAG TPA: MSMEG_0567/Sll0786 family nitrogen starvation N-acetyltransferase [Pseudonocardia sp.]|jgi:putative N-acetyltransferase (TIGR04045 family)
MTLTQPEIPPLETGRPVSCQVLDGTSAELLTAHYAIRHAVFVDEQRVFPDSDRDERDERPGTLHLIGLVGAIPAGTVRIYPLDPAEPGSLWQGDRLAVLPEFRTCHVGAPLVRLAVATAGALGGERMIAHIQRANGTFFRRLGWTRRAEELYFGLPHLLVDIELSNGSSDGPSPNR